MTTTRVIRDNEVVEGNVDETPGPVIKTVPLAAIAPKVLKTPNPFAPAVAGLAAEFKDDAVVPKTARQVVVSGPVTGPTAQRTKRLLGEAGRDAGISVRQRATFDGVNTEILFWAAPKRTRTTRN